MRRNRIIAVLATIVFLTIGFVFNQLGFKWFLAYLIIITFLSSGIFVIPLMGWAGKAQKAYELYGGILGYLLLHVVAYLWAPIGFEFTTQSIVFWIFETLFLIVNCALLGHTWITIFSTKVATAILIILAIFHLGVFATGKGGKLRARIAAWETNIMNSAIDSVYIEADVENEAVTKRKDLDDAKGTKKRAKEGKMTDADRKEIEKRKSKMEQGNTPDYPKRQTIIREFDIPAGTGENVEDNIYPTGLFPNKNDRVQCNVIGGGPVHYRSGITDKDRVKISKSRTIRITGDGGEVQFIQLKEPSKVEVKIIPRKY